MTKAVSGLVPATGANWTDLEKFHKLGRHGNEVPDVPAQPVVEMQEQGGGHGQDAGQRRDGHVVVGADVVEQELARVDAQADGRGGECDAGDGDDVDGEGVARVVEGRPHGRVHRAHAGRRTSRGGRGGGRKTHVRGFRQGSGRRLLVDAGANEDSGTVRRYPAESW